MPQLADKGPYTMVRRCLTKRANRQEFSVIVYGAYNAYGLIGPEFNGIAVLNETRRSVVLDSHVQESSGYFGASAAQLAEFDRLKGMKAREFLAFVRQHPRYREGTAA